VKLAAQRLQVFSPSPDSMTVSRRSFSAALVVGLQVSLSLDLFRAWHWWRGAIKKFWD